MCDTKLNEGEGLLILGMNLTKKLVWNDSISSVKKIQSETLKNA